MNESESIALVRLIAMVVATLGETPSRRSVQDALKRLRGCGMRNGIIDAGLHLYASFADAGDRSNGTPIASSNGRSRGPRRVRLLAAFTRNIRGLGTTPAPPRNRSADWGPAGDHAGTTPGPLARRFYEGISANGDQPGTGRGPAGDLTRVRIPVTYFVSTDPQESRQRYEDAVSLRSTASGEHKCSPNAVGGETGKDVPPGQPGRQESLLPDQVPNEPVQGARRSVQLALRSQEQADALSASRAARDAILAAIWVELQPQLTRPTTRRAWSDQYGNRRTAEHLAKDYAVEEVVAAWHLESKAMGVPTLALKRVERRLVEGAAGDRPVKRLIRGRWVVETKEQLAAQKASYDSMTRLIESLPPDKEYVDRAAGQAALRRLLANAEREKNGEPVEKCAHDAKGTP